jgi:hypothetical protein
MTAGLLLATALALADGGARAEPTAGRKLESVVLLPGLSAFDEARLVEDLSRRWKPLAVKVVGRSRGGFTLALGEGRVSVTPLKRRYADVDLDKAAAASWQWSGARSAVKRHQAHVLIEAQATTADPALAALDITRVAASLAASAPQSLAVFWAMSGTLLSPKVFVRGSADARRDHLPLELWINFLPAPLPDKRPAVHTTGFTALSYPELVLEEGLGGPEETLDLVFRVAAYLFDQNTKMRVGDTIRVSPSMVLVATERLPEGIHLIPKMR